EHVYLLESEDSVSEYQKKMVPSVRRNQLLQEYNQLHSLFVKKDGDASTLPSSLSYENEHALIKLQETQGIIVLLLKII
ncbi:hypothetical protein, partial [Enterobacter cloacae complex sp. 4DZ1-17B1]|uniref:hypothetical protein n=1 Tax=Enterobacter cloacae complex sp. 4DZ1-17B1 TaxID=2511991 RepID=UPI001CA50A78